MDNQCPFCGSGNVTVEFLSKGVDRVTYNDGNALRQDFQLDTIEHDSIIGGKCHDCKEKWYYEDDQIKKEEEQWNAQQPT